MSNKKIRLEVRLGEIDKNRLNEIIEKLDSSEGYAIRLAIKNLHEKVTGEDEKDN